MRNYITILIIVFTAKSGFSQDTLNLIRNSDNVVGISFASASMSPKMIIKDKIVKKQTLTDISRIYNVVWTEEDYRHLMDFQALPTKIKVLDAGIPRNGKTGNASSMYNRKDTALYDWLEIAYHHAEARKPALLKEAQAKNGSSAGEEKSDPWIHVIFPENCGYSSSEIRTELKDRGITRVYFEIPVTDNQPFSPDPGSDFAGPPPPPPPMPEKPYDPNAPLHVVDEKAQFPGGAEALKVYILKNLRYPDSALKAGIQGKAYVKFVVEKTGEISDISIAKKVPGCPECDAEALRLAKGMPKWIPAKVGGVAVDSYFNLPVPFKLN